MNLKNNVKVFISIFALFIICNTSLNAAKKRGAYATKNLVGQEYYMKRCSSCHGEALRGGNSDGSWKAKCPELFAKYFYDANR